MGHGITDTDNMIYVGETPWHRLGTKLDAPPTVEEALVKAGLDWTIRTERLDHTFDLLRGTSSELQARDIAWMRARGFKDYGLERRGVSGQVVIRNDTNTELGVVGPRWKPVNNVDALRWFDRWIETGKVEIETAGSLEGGKKVWALARIKSDPIKIVGHDAVNKYVLISLAHDGKQSIRAGLTAIRVVCANTLGFAISAGERDEADGKLGLFRVTHTTRALERLEDVADKIEAADARLTRAGEVYRTLAANQVTSEDLATFAAYVYEQPIADVRKGHRLKRLTKRFEEGVGQDLPGAKGTTWGLYNALTELETHGFGKRATKQSSMEGRADRNVNGAGAKRLQRGLDVAYVMATKSYSLAEVFGPWADVVSMADAEHPNADLIEVDREDHAA